MWGRERVNVITMHFIGGLKINAHTHKKKKRPTNASVTEYALCVSAIINIEKWMTHVVAHSMELNQNLFLNILEHINYIF